MAKQIKIKGVKLVKPEFETPTKEEKESKEATLEEVQAPKPVRKKKVKPSTVKLGEELRAKVEDLELLTRIYEKSTDTISNADRKIQDILHDLENDDITYHEIAALGKELKHLRTERRRAKDTEALLKDLYDILKDGQTKHVLNKLKAEAGKIKNKEAKMKERIYVYRG